jgi:hypothetical protein
MMVDAQHEARREDPICWVGWHERSLSTSKIAGITNDPASVVMKLSSALRSEGTRCSSDGSIGFPAGCATLMRFYPSDSSRGNEPHAFVTGKILSLLSKDFRILIFSCLISAYTSQLISGSAWFNVVLHLQDRWHLTTIGVVLIKFFFPYWEQADLSSIVCEVAGFPNGNSLDHKSGDFPMRSCRTSIVLPKCPAGDSDPLILAWQVHLDHVLRGFLSDQESMAVTAGKGKILFVYSFVSVIIFVVW